MFLYADLKYDEADPWKGLLRGKLLVNVCILVTNYLSDHLDEKKIQAFKFVFTSPSSVEKDASKATRSGNARLHGMTRTTKASIAYIATQVRQVL